MKKISLLLILSICLTLFIFSGCDSNSVETQNESNTQTSETETNSISNTVPDISESTKIPSHELYYSITEDFPEYFYYWPISYRGIIIDSKLQYYNVYGSISIKTLQAEYTSDIDIIQAEIFLPSDGYAENAYDEIGILGDLGLEKMIDGVWTPVAFDGDSDYYFNLISENCSYLSRSRIPSEGKTISRELNTDCLYEPLTSGHYRLILFLDDCTLRYAEFDIK